VIIATGEKGGGGGRGKERGEGVKVKVSVKVCSVKMGGCLLLMSFSRVAAIF
jgi:hypothetical protein